MLYVRNSAILRVILFLVPIMLISSLSPLGAFDKIGTTGAVFLKIGMGARASGLSGAFVAIADDPSLLYWNPGGAGFVRAIRVEGGYNRWFGGVKQGYLYILMPVGKFSTVGVGLSTLNSGKIEITTLDEPEGNGLFYSYTGTVLSVSYARLLSSSFSMGVGFKGVEEGIWRERAFTYAFDFGALYKTEFRGLDIGISLSNIGGRVQLDGPDLRIPVELSGSIGGHPEIEGLLGTGKWPLPVLFRLGIAQQLVGRRGLLGRSNRSTLRLSLQGTHHSEARQDLSIGLEFQSRFVSLRGGVKIGSDTENWSSGLSLNVPWGFGGVRFDYAITDMGILGLVQRVSLLRSF